MSPKPSDGLSPHHRTLLEEHLELICECVDEIGVGFYDRLFRRHPEMQAHFGSTAGPGRQLMVLHMLSSVASSLEGPSWLYADLATVAKTHDVDYEVQPAMYDQAADCLVDALAEVSGEAWHPELERAWQERLRWLSRTMTGGPTPRLRPGRPTQPLPAEAPFDPPARCPPGPGASCGATGTE